MKEQNVSKLAKAIIATYFEKYTATEIQKQKIKNKRIYDNSLIEKRKSEKYGQVNLLNKNSNNIITFNKTNELTTIDNKRWYKVLWKKIKNFLGKINKLISK